VVWTQLSRTPPTPPTGPSRTSTLMPASYQISRNAGIQADFGIRHRRVRQGPRSSRSEPLVGLGILSSMPLDTVRFISSPSFQKPAFHTTDRPERSVLLTTSLEAELDTFLRWPPPTHSVAFSRPSVSSRRNSSSNFTLAFCAGHGRILSAMVFGTHREISRPTQSFAFACSTFCL
jgi:hypothetical protein